ncbi:hypothetical protein F4804DRAFT_93954 [Jackrogersella minutella]|nr:hypothetical protein F4804DRAFT_93954 [Jackrogersella minutella]
MSLKAWHKGVYTWYIDCMLKGVKPDRRLPFLQQERLKLLRRYEILSQAEKIYAEHHSEYEKACGEAKRITTWRLEAIEPCISEMEAYEQGFKSMAKTESSKSIWDRIYLTMKKQLS